MHDLQEVFCTQRQSGNNNTQKEIEDMTDLEFFMLMMLNMVGICLILWRVECVSESVRDDIAAIEREIYLNETDTIHPRFSTGAEK